MVILGNITKRFYTLLNLDNVNYCSTRKQWAAITPKNLGLVREKIRREWNVVVSKDTIKRILKCLGMRWKRIRTTVGGKPDPELYQRKKQIINALKKLSDNGAIDF